MNTLYRQLADEVAEDIEHGIYGAGQKVPSVRQLSKQRAVSISTVTQAYALLEDRGFLRSKPQSGYFVRDGIQEVFAAPPMSSGSHPEEVTKATLINDMLAVCNQPTHVNLGAAIPDLCCTPYRTMQTHIQKVARFQAREVFNYQFSPGLEQLRGQIAIRMRETGVRSHGDDIVITHGCAEAISLTLRCATQPGDIVAVESPCYYGFLQQAKLIGLKVIEIPTDPETGISVDALKLAMQQWPIKLVAVTSRYSNPSGATLNVQKQKDLIQLANRYEITILEDDIYGELGYDQPLQSVLKTFDTEDRVVYCSSFSKSISPGLRIGWCIPGKYLQEMIQHQMFNTFSPSALTQHAISNYLQTGHFDKHLRSMRTVYRDNTERMIHAIKQYFPQGTCVSKPRGGFILWVCLPKDVSAVALQQACLRHEINIVPGDIFSNGDEFSNYIRLNCAIPWSDTILAALKTIGELTHKEASKH